jgi:hypothetical protein
LFIYTPVALLALLGLWNVKKLDNKKIKQFLYIAFLAVILEILVYGCYETWWAGWSYGPRYLTGTLPIIAILISLSLPNNIGLKKLSKKEVLVIAVLILLVIPSIFSQIIGAFYYPGGNWDGNPNINNNPGRLWDWHDTQMGRSFDAGLAKPNLVSIGFLDHL